ncbi:protein translocase subunit SecD [Candidatus Woesearchaeota archaeon]|jgi:preprotein translocase subunit SecD|nr:protein translocase subunit SecD [Candidatus Woesearchaeota archaeon]MBT7062480.1 protein translocase subunit SecD [Candidatus Woesearchaeota archaeon]MBT7402913.1 protein translocase subunit SecD [Candidatus Woesearchaeota archaeon]
MDKLKKILFDWKVILLIIFLLLSIWTIQPRFSSSGAYVDTINKNSSAEISGIDTGHIITNINGQEIETLNAYANIVSELEIGSVATLETNKGNYKIVYQEDGLGINIKEVPTSNLKKGLDLVGGARVILKPDGEVTEQQFIDAMDIISKRLNIYGLSDVAISQTRSIEGDKYIIVELAGATREDVEKLIGQQGKFEAQIGGETVFVGGQDIKSVCRSADCSGIDLRTCGQSQEGGIWQCRFSFRVDVSQESAQKHSEITSKLDIVTNNGERYLSEKLDLYLDDELFDSLYISEDLQGKVSTSFVIQGPGQGQTKEAAITAGLENMKQFQTLLITGSLPVKLDIEKIDIVSPTLGEQFFTSAILALAGALLAVGVVIFIRYRKLKIAIPILITGTSEIIIILGFAALIKWNLDLAAIAGILAAVGTGVDHQIVITDEVLKGAEAMGNWKERIKRAFFIIMAAYFTTVVAMAPLLIMGAGMLKGFALTTIAGVSIGVFITRPAFAKIIEILLND